jgi:hypothetical protein
MIMGRFSARRILLASVGGLIAVVVIGGGLMMSAEGGSYFEGVWYVFNVVSTVGFGPGPASDLGQLLAVLAFWFAGACWFGILLVAIEVGYARFQRYALIDEALRPLARRPHDRLFTEN